MTRMTAARIERWQKDLDKALALVRRVEADVVQAKMSATGSILSGVMDLHGTLRGVRAGLEAETSDSMDVSSIARLRSRLLARKAARSSS